MKKGVVLLVLGLMSWTVAGSALAGPFGRFQRAARPSQSQRIMPRGGMSGPEDGVDNREKDRGGDRGDRGDRNNAGVQQAALRGEAQRNAERNPEPGPGGIQQMPAMPGGRAGARMSLEERQKLRRQINEAGRSLYMPPAPTGNK